MNQAITRAYLGALLVAIYRLLAHDLNTPHAELGGICTYRFRSTRMIVCSPRKPDLSAYRLLVNGDEVRRYMERFPALNRSVVIDALLIARPDRMRAEELLKQAAAASTKP